MRVATRIAAWFFPACVAVGLVLSDRPISSPACCPAPPPGSRVLNADQTVVILWDADRKMQHFIRQASFKSEADDFGFLIPSPNEPELNESGNGAFPYLADVTKPEVITQKRPAGGGGCGCAATMMAPGEAANRRKDEPAVQALKERTVGGGPA